jgi:phosphoribosylanthranilate isomerase
MSLSAFVKINAVNNLSDARYCAGMGVQLMGFCLEPGHSKSITPDKYREMTGWISGVELAGEFDNSHPEHILEIAQECPGLGYIEVKEEAFLPMLMHTGFQLIWKAQVERPEDLDALMPKAGYFNTHNILLHLVSDHMILDETVLDKISHLCGDCEVLVGFGINAENVLDLLETAQPKGISLEGGEEIKPGFKDFDELSEILEILEEEE